MSNDIAAEKLYESINAAHPAPHTWTPWKLASDEDKEYYRRLVSMVLANSPAPNSTLDGEVLVRLPGMYGAQPIKHIFRCELEGVSIHKACVEIQEWLLELTRGMRA